MRLTYYPEGSSSGGFISFEGEDGTFDHGSLLPGRYRLVALRGGQRVHESEPIVLRSGETTDVGTLALGAQGTVELAISGIPEDELRKLHAALHRDGHSTEELTHEDGVLTSHALLPGTWTVRIMGSQWFVPHCTVDVVADETTRIELTAALAYEVPIECAVLEGVWRTMRYEVRDQKGGARPPRWPMDPEPHSGAVCSRCMGCYYRPALTWSKHRRTPVCVDR